MLLSPEDVRILTRLHGGLPLVDRPFAEIGAELGMAEEHLIERLRQLLAQGVLTRFGPLFQIERAGGRFVLAALAVPEHRYDEVTTLVNALPEVAHNYRRESTGPLDATRLPPEGERSRLGAARHREHALNMWFVVAADSPEKAEGALRRIEADTGLPVFAFPKEREYFVELKLPLDHLEANDAAR